MAEADALRSLPPPPPIGAEMLTLQQAELENVRSRFDKAQREICALVVEKGRLEETLRKKADECRNLAEEKVGAIAALGRALKQATHETPPSADHARSERLNQTVASQKKTIEALRKELAALQARNVQNMQNAQDLQNLQRAAAAKPPPAQTLHGQQSQTNGNAATRERLTLQQRQSDETRRLLRELETANERLALTQTHFQSDRASMSTSLALLRRQLGESQHEAAELAAQIQELRHLRESDLSRATPERRHPSLGEQEAAQRFQVAVRIPNCEQLPAVHFERSARSGLALLVAYLWRPLSLLRRRGSHRLVSV